MATRRKEAQGSDQAPQKRRPATTPDGRENQLVAPFIGSVNNTIISKINNPAYNIGDDFINIL